MTELKHEGRPSSMDDLSDPAAFSWETEASVSPPLSDSRFLLLERIGAGGLGEIHLARVQGLNDREDQVALKRLSADVSSQRGFVRSFVRQVRKAALLMHPNIVQIIEIGWMERSLYVAMEHVDGLDLGRLTSRLGPTGLSLSPSQIAYIGCQVASALAYAHSWTESSLNLTGLVHGDISPSNIYITEREMVKLANFSTIRATGLLDRDSRLQRLSGKVAYFSPELAEGQHATAASDVFSLGVVLWELLAGRSLFGAGSFHETLERVQGAEIPEIDGLESSAQGLLRIIHQALARAPEARYPDAAQLARDLRQEATRTDAAVTPLSALVSRASPRLERRGEGDASRVVAAQPIGLGSLRGKAPAPREERPAPSNAPPRSGGASSVVLPPTSSSSNGRYHLERQLGAGGIGITYLATTRGAAGFEKKVVIKRLQPRFGKDPTLTRTLIDEAKTAVRLVHPNVVAIYDLGLDHDGYFIAMEYVAGRDLSSLLALEDGVPADLLIYIAMQVLAALEYAHSYTDEAGQVHEVIHRDVSPENILVSLDGSVKLTDFGIAKIRSQLSQTMPGTVKGKVGYMSPEQASGRPLDHRTDLYQIGILLFEGLTGEQLFPAESQLEMLQLASRGEVPKTATRRPNLDPYLAEIVDRALQKDPELRFQSAQELSDALATTVSTTTEQALRRETAEFLREVTSGERLSGMRVTRTSLVDLVAPTVQEIFVLTQDTLVTQALSPLGAILGEPEFELRLLEGPVEIAEAQQAIEAQQITPAGVVFGGLSVALEEPLLAALRGRSTRKVLVVDEPQAEVLSLAANLCGLDAVVQLPLEPARLLELFHHDLGLGQPSSQVMALQRKLEQSRAVERELRAEMGALALANVRAAELVAEIQEKDRLLRRVVDVLMSPDSEEGGPATGLLTGSLDRLGLGELTELMRVGRCSASLTLEQGSRKGEVRFDRGIVTEVRQGLLAGEPAFEQMSAWSRGSFRLISTSPPSARQTRSALASLIPPEATLDPGAADKENLPYD